MAISALWLSWLSNLAPRHEMTELTITCCCGIIIRAARVLEFQTCAAGACTSAHTFGPARQSTVYTPYRFAQSAAACVRIRSIGSVALSLRTLLHTRLRLAPALSLPRQRRSSPRLGQPDQLAVHVRSGQYQSGG